MDFSMIYCVCLILLQRFARCIRVCARYFAAPGGGGFFGRAAFYSLRRRWLHFSARKQDAARGEMILQRANIAPLLEML
jgi:hypothetical protein